MVTETSRIGRSLQLDSRVTLLDALREYLDLVSTEKAALKAAAASKYAPKK